MEMIVALDRQIFEWLVIHANPAWLTQLSEYLGQVKIIVYPALILFAVSLFKNPRSTIINAVMIILFLILAELTVSLLKSSIMRPRPGMQMGIYADPRGFSFPSAHSFNTAALATLVWIQAPRWRYAAVMVAFVTGVSRVFANYHFPLDVLGGWTFGALFAILLIKGTRMLQIYIANQFSRGLPKSDM